MLPSPLFSLTAISNEDHHLSACISKEGGEITQMTQEHKNQDGRFRGLKRIDDPLSQGTALATEHRDEGEHFLATATWEEIVRSLPRHHPFILYLEQNG